MSLWIFLFFLVCSRNVFHLGRVLSSRAPASPMTSPYHPPSGGVTKVIQVRGGACWERPTPVGIPQLQSATWQGATGEKEEEKDDKDDT